MAALGQSSDEAHYIQYPFKGFVQLYNNDKVKYRGISFINSDSIKLFVRLAERHNTHPVRVLTSRTELMNINVQIVPIAQIKMLKENKHTFTKGAIAGGTIGFGLGFLFGYLTYDSPIMLGGNGDDERKGRGAMVGLAGALPCSLVGGLVGRMIFRKRFKINGDKELFVNTLNKIYY